MESIIGILCSLAAFYVIYIINSRIYSLENKITDLEDKIKLLNEKKEDNENNI